ncbi:hypothetical protein V6N13_093785 [Hibiscus sabdariffa]|uniref:Uncharacterized protein n=1 Tax=Hibiscus sabdariffa TaxID=183260 RepID=A0ABR2NKQ0_9ROSI
MGAKVSKHSRPKRESKALVLTSEISSKKSSMVEAIERQCWRKRRAKNNGIKRLPEGRIIKARKLTLEDWLLASPGNPLEVKDYLKGGELHVFKHFSSKIHPSPSGEIQVTDDGLSVKLSSASSFCRSLSGKSEKKVSFRLPGEADIRTFYSPTYRDSAVDYKQQSF